MKIDLRNVVSFALTGTVVALGSCAIYDRMAFAATERNCLAMNVYHEARGESVIGQIAVAQVVMNRVDHNYFPDTVCDVVYQDHQFSWTQDNISDTTSDTFAWNLAKDIAITVYAREEDDPTSGALFYHADYIDTPHWAKQMETTLREETHIFYSWDGVWD